MDIAREEDFTREVLSVGANVEKENGQVHPGKGLSPRLAWPCFQCKKKALVFGDSPAGLSRKTGNLQISSGTPAVMLNRRGPVK